ncbi:nucleotide-binding universal stress UspA family protein [Microbacterium trichothecenolyticum]|uniref:universal stress protein n=1 Tax=Microbacterium trichothecenolyticum TaxID=69370 RepID=UPI002856B84C|nr:universal stress protein [Microbacterium trichothecenolyticum]MDR7183205.1 nucleotide-binding universal stress UspA family protein [Microbacterium trichothecenolyticum]
MNARVVVGYTATDAGADAVALGARLAAAMDAPLDLVLVLPAEDRSVITPPDAGYDRFLVTQAEAWLAEAAAKIPDAVTHASHVRFGDSFAEGLIAAAHELSASHIVVGAANGGLRGRHRLGTVANELLHSSDVPVVLAPEGSRRLEPSTGITRITAAIGTRPGADVLLEESVALAAATGAGLRLLSLAAVDMPPSLEAMEFGARHADDVFVHVRAALPKDIETDAVVGLGDSVEDAVSHLSWEPGELAVVGSSRLARRRRLFLGSTAAKMLHELPVPMVVVPRTRGKKGAR